MGKKPKARPTGRDYIAKTKPTWKDHLRSLSERLLAGSWKLRSKARRKSRARS